MSDKKRKILFRGKENPSGKWIEGFLVGNCHIGDWVTATPVHSKTVGQFTGLTDKNGKKIFEGDIVDIIDGTEYGVIEWLDDEAMFACHERGYWSCLDSYSKNTISVVGNIHDNPELLKEAPNV